MLAYRLGKVVFKPPWLTACKLLQNIIISTLCWVLRVLRYYYFRLCPLFWKCTIQWTDHHLEQSAACTTSSTAVTECFHMFNEDALVLDRALPLRRFTGFGRLTYLLTYLLRSHFEYFISQLTMVTYRPTRVCNRFVCLEPKNLSVSLSWRWISHS